MIKKANFAGSFYPDRADELMEIFDSFGSDQLATSSKIVIAPHAGYIYSGFTASLAYRSIQNAKTIAIIAPSHRVGFAGFSACEFGSYATPLGEIEADLELLNTLQNKLNIACYPEAHLEHSSETQLPLIKHYQRDAKVLEFIYSYTTREEIYELIGLLIENDATVVISSDLSHFYSLPDANRLDKLCIDAVLSLDENMQANGCEACGGKGIEAAIMYAKKHNLTPKLLDYRTSADATGDDSSVVGYMSACFEQNKKDNF